MSEEQPVFKVTDRRLFNSDGTPREVPPAEESQAQPAKATAPAAEEAQPAAASSTAAAPEAATASAESQATAASASAAPAATPAETELPPEEDYAEGDIPGADDPASFINFLMSIASNAAAALGMMEHPVTGQRAFDPELGKHWIDVLGMLEEKTRGNLSAQEQQIFEGLLADLRMQYVSLSSTRQPKAPRGFTGNDILGK